ncbi:MAG: ImmA/IrrE family metallo-endopeptidase [Phycisphaerales bacterium]|nr:MAG: ImmA/IrrE family metallo-endopeptidase [Phycisphaerales bacterium]
MASLSQASGKDKAKQLRQRIDASVDSLAKAVDDVRASETFQRFLEVQARFHKYSWHNCFLICMQRPDATQVAGYRTWQKLGRQVCKGERGIMIFAPRPFKREVEHENGDTEKVEGIYFRAVHVFDVAQTDGEDLPTVDVPTIEAAADGLLASLERVCVNRGVKLDYGKLDGGRYGVSKRGTVEVDNSHPTGQQAKTLAHELAHEALHWEDKGPFTRSLAELEAESVAYVVCLHFGLDTEVRSSRYIALWDGDSKALRASLERIANTARDIIDDVEALGARKAVA